MCTGCGLVMWIRLITSKNCTAVTAHGCNSRGHRPCSQVFGLNCVIFAEVIGWACCRKGSYIYIYTECMCDYIGRDHGEPGSIPVQLRMSFLVVKVALGQCFL